MSLLEQKLARIAQLKREMDKAKEYRAEFEQLKDEVFMEMQALQSDKTKATGGVYGLITRKVTPRVTDVEALRQWLEAEGYAPMDYMTAPELDVTRIDNIAKQAKQDNGEIIPGLDYYTNETLSIRSEKK